MKTLILISALLLSLGCVKESVKPEGLVSRDSLKEDTTSKPDSIQPVVTKWVLFPSPDWHSTNRINLKDSDNYAALTIVSDPKLVVTEIRNCTALNFGNYPKLRATIVIDSMSTNISTGYYPLADAWQFSVMNICTFATWGQIIHSGTNVIDMTWGVNYFNSWNTACISDFAGNNAYPKYIKIRSIVMEAI